MYQSPDQWAESIALTKNWQGFLFSHHPLFSKLLPGAPVRAVKLRDLRRSMGDVQGMKELHPMKRCNTEIV